MVVTYHPEGEVLENLRALRPQVRWLVVVDNGSTAEELGGLRALSGELGFALVENGKNLGIATALNVGVRRGLEWAPEWFLFFDQDSQVTAGFVETMLRGFRESVFGDRLALLVPRYQDKRSGAAIATDRLREGGVEAAMTSGSLVRAETMGRYGGFLEELFIDMVDSEFCLRLRAAGRVIDDCGDAVLLHSPGSPEYFRVGGRRLFLAGNYSAVRYYYQQRNRVWVARRYGKRFPGFVRRLMVHSAKELFKLVVAERDRWAKLKAFAGGVGDGLRGRMGERR